MNDDAALLRSYVEDGSEEGFTKLVEHHVDLVYNAALRRTGGNFHRAADVAQHVFTALARQAHTLIRHPSISAWLYATTRNVAVNLSLSERRRQRRQYVAFELESLQGSAPSPEWDSLRKVLDSAIDELPERDRLPVVMRFLERRTFKDIGVALKVSEDAARVRTERAITKLRLVLERHGITSTAAAHNDLDLRDCGCTTWVSGGAGCGGVVRNCHRRRDRGNNCRSGKVCRNCGEK